METSQSQTASGERRVGPDAPRQTLALPCDAGSPGAARRFVASALAIPAPLDMTVALVVSELASNAVLHAHSPFTITLAWDERTIQVAITDSSPKPPVVKYYESSSVTGRGLRIITHVASRWGWEPHEGGKTVWFEIDDALEITKGASR